MPHGQQQLQYQSLCQKCIARHLPPSYCQVPIVQFKQRELSTMLSNYSTVQLISNFKTARVCIHARVCVSATVGNANHIVLLFFTGWRMQCYFVRICNGQAKKIAFTNYLYYWFR